MNSIALKSWEVRGILDGRITHLVRPVMPQPVYHPEDSSYEWPDRFYFPEKKFSNLAEMLTTHLHFIMRVREGNEHTICPFGKPGDRVWVKEHFDWCYDRDGEVEVVTYVADMEGGDSLDADSYVGAMDMPERLSRLTLEVLSVRVERLHNLGINIQIQLPGEIRREPVFFDEGKVVGEIPIHDLVFRANEMQDIVNERNQKIRNEIEKWNTEYPKTPWESNPWVFIGEVRKVEV